MAFQVFDIAKELRIDPKLLEDREKYTVDSLHFNDAGTSVIADVMIKCIERIQIQINKKAKEVFQSFLF